MPAKLLMTIGFFALLAASPAHARFGKRTESAPAHSKGPRPSVSRQGHAATPVNACCASAPTVAPSPSFVSPGWSRRRSRGWGWYRAGYVPVAVSPAYAPQLEAREEPDSVPVRVTVGAEGMAFPAGGAASLGLAIEGDRAGISAAFNHLAVAATDGTGGLDTIQQLNLHFTYAVLAGSHGRLRVEGGADSAFAPDLTVVGPGLGASGVVWVGGPLALEGSVTVTPFPFRQVDCRAGLGLGLGALGLRAGWRSLLLDDAGLVDGVDHLDFFSGPYVGVALTF